jgi:hypothetical protein
MLSGSRANRYNATSLPAELELRPLGEWVGTLLRLLKSISIRLPAAVAQTDTKPNQPSYLQICLVLLCIGPASESAPLILGARTWRRHGLSKQPLIIRGSQTLASWLISQHANTRQGTKLWHFCGQTINSRIIHRPPRFICSKQTGMHNVSRYCMAINIPYNIHFRNAC